MSSLRLFVSGLLATCVLPSPVGLADDDAVPASIVLKSPAILPAGAGVDEFVFHALDSDGALLTEFSDTATVSGVQVGKGDFAAPAEPLTGEFRSGVLRLRPPGDSSALTTVSQEITVGVGADDWRIAVSTRPAWLRLLPPILAIGLAVLLKNVIVALILAVISGCLLYLPLPDVWQVIPAFCRTMVEQVADYDHASVILFTLLLGAMIGLMNDSGGTGSAINWMARYAHTRRKGMVLTWLTGLLVFFDDYANTMLIGGAMRPMSDRLGFSRAKLAFLIDATAAPIAGLAISTWTAFEIDQIVTAFAAAGIEGDATRFFWSTIPYRIYPILMIAVVGAVAVSGRDFGAMLRAERNQTAREAAQQQSITHGSQWLAAVPVLTLVVITVSGFVLGVDAYQLLLIASFVSSSVAFVLAAFCSPLSLDECSRSWTAGIGSMMPAVIVLVLAWGVSAVCQTDRLDTAGYLIGIVGDSISVEFLPATAFILSGAIAVAIGSSFTTMALLIPMLLPLTWTILQSAAAASLNNPALTATIGAILAGAIFGDHCSPISDTTVLSSAAADCEHLEHVATQLPYALLTAVATVLLGYLPIGFGVPWWICLPAATLACVGGIVFLGQDSDVTRSP